MTELIVRVGLFVFLVVCGIVVLFVARRRNRTLRILNRRGTYTSQRWFVVLIGITLVLGGIYALCGPFLPFQF